MKLWRWVNLAECSAVFASLDAEGNVRISREFSALNCTSAMT
jgi:hypothetical protein